MALQDVALFIQIVSQVVGPLAIFGGFVVAGRSLKVTERQSQLTAKQFEMAQQQFAIITEQAALAKQKEALALFETYFSEEMRLARHGAWGYFVTEKDEKLKEERLQEYVAYLTDPKKNYTVDPLKMEQYQQLSRVLDYFAIVNGCLRNGSVDADMIRTFLAYYYKWWHEGVIVAARGKLKRQSDDDPRTNPLWFSKESLSELDALCTQPVLAPLHASSSDPKALLPRLGSIPDE